MYDNNSKGISFTAAVFLLLAFTIAGLYLANLINNPIWTVMTGQNYDQFTLHLADPAYSKVYKVIQAVTEVIGFFVPAIVVAALLNKKPLRLIGFSSGITMKQIGLVLVIMTAAFFVAGAFGYLNYQIPLPADWRVKFDAMEAENSKQAQAILGLKNSGDYIIALIVMGVLPAICEEALFRGALQNFLSRSLRQPWMAIVITSLIFSAAHFSWYGFLFRVTLGIVLGALYYYSGKLWLSILGHFLNNALVITVCYIYMRQGKPISDVSQNTSSYWGMLALPVLVGLLMIYKRIFFNSRPQY